MRKSRRPTTPTVLYARTRFYSALEIALVGLLFIVGAMRASGAPQEGGTPAQGGGTPAQGEAALAEAAGRLGSPKAQDRLLAARSLGSSASPKAAVPALLGALRTEKHPAVREHLVAALGDLRDPAAVPALLDLAARAPETGVRTGAVLALSQIADPAAVSGLERLARDAAQPAAVRKGSLLMIGQRKGKQSLALLEAAAADKDEDVREAAVDALGRVDDPRAEAAVARALEDADPKVRKAAAEIEARRKKRGGRR